MEIPPSRVVWFDKNNREHTSRKVFTSSEEVAEWYKHMRSRIYGLSIVVPLNQKSLTVVQIDALREKIIQQLREQLGREPTESEIQTSLKSIDEHMG